MVFDFLDYMFYEVCEKGDCEEMECIWEVFSFYYESVLE